MEIDTSAEELREQGKYYLFHHGGDEDLRKQGIRLLLKAQRKQDPEAMFIIAHLMLKGFLKPLVPNPQRHALTMMHTAANRGCIQARAFLNDYCEKRYAEKFASRKNIVIRRGKLVDFRGEIIKINRKGALTPIDAVLEYKNGENVLTLSTNLCILGTEEAPDSAKFSEAVRQGIKEWEGTYEVFGGQKLRVKVEVSEERRLYDNLIVLPMTDDINDAMLTVSNAIATDERRREMKDIVESKRSFATSGVKWSINSRKLIYLQSKNGRFDDYDEIKHVVKHEFGHALGLGDLYYSPSDHLPGVQNGSYRELDSYAVSDKVYNLVMCDHNGPISNNDIEMVVLAFRENRMQHFQLRKYKGKISTALGRGN